MPWSQTAEYALRAAVCLAGRRGHALSTDAIAEATQVPRDYLSKVLQTLARAGLVRAQRGLGGGFLLAREPGAVSALDVVNAVDPLRRIRECPLGFAGHGRQLCALHRRMDNALAELERALDSACLSDLVRAGETAGLCSQRGDAAAPVPLRVRQRGRRRAGAASPSRHRQRS
jgi:Rrf2 family transcriptional regulator, nitric oxide-sensitive transcriptional repressor